MSFRRSSRSAADRYATWILFMMRLTFLIELHVADLARNQSLGGEEIILEGLDYAILLTKTITGITSHFLKQISYNWMLSEINKELGIIKNRLKRIELIHNLLPFLFLVSVSYSSITSSISPFIWEKESTIQSFRWFRCTLIA